MNSVKQWFETVLLGLGLVWFAGSEVAVPTPRASLIADPLAAVEPVSRSDRQRNLAELAERGPFAAHAAMDLAREQAPEAFALLVGLAHGDGSDTSSNFLATVAIEGLACYRNREAAGVLAGIAARAESSGRRTVAARALEAMGSDLGTGPIGTAPRYL